MNLKHTFPEDIVNFYNRNKDCQFSHSPNKAANVNWIIKDSGLSWLKMNIDFPYQEMHDEAVQVYDKFVIHRGDPEPNRKWKSVCIHGLASHFTNDIHYYDFNREDYEWHWTEVADLCPITTDFLKNQIQIYKQYYRVRFMLLEPGGYIFPHVDSDKNQLLIINYALNQPNDCHFIIEDKGIIPYTTGSAFFIDLANKHCIFNDSDEQRIHLIIHAHEFNTDYFDPILLESYNENQN